MSDKVSFRPPLRIFNANLAVFCPSGVQPRSPVRASEIGGWVLTMADAELEAEIAALKQQLAEMTEELKECRRISDEVPALKSQVFGLKEQIRKFFSAVHDTYGVIGECFTHLSEDTPTDPNGRPDVD